MKNFDFKRIRLSKDGTSKLHKLKNKTGITPNISCRIALCMSLEEKNIPSLELYYSEEGQEINKHTFLGDISDELLSLFLFWCSENNVEFEEYYKYLIANINRGIELLTNRVKNLSDFSILCED